MKNELMLNKGKAMACLIIICLFFALSCRKDRPQLNTPQLNNAPLGQYIKQEVLEKWLETNPVAKYLSLDWSKARQAVIQGKNVVRVPTLNVDKTASLNKNTTLGDNLPVKDRQTSNSVTTGNNSNYDAQHPPEVFFIEDEGNTRLRTYLLNFIPTDKTKEVGENRL